MKTDKIDNFCKGCKHLKKLCDGCYDDSFSNCIWKNTDADVYKKFLDDYHLTGMQGKAVK